MNNKNKKTRCSWWKIHLKRRVKALDAWSWLMEVDYLRKKVKYQRKQHKNILKEKRIDLLKVTTWGRCGDTGRTQVEEIPKSSSKEEAAIAGKRDPRDAQHAENSSGAASLP